ncbi:hypothetical protein BN946_scf184835.g11 [Trametes cinnabarina]|uniref:Uncharacterized protein n=1 Tax=Pycnoporus cinnabarinus TaxID=5643 RepID=A0A060SYS3_PYCCI|nr:hypothetical protein BN946_scf184835.g11 [Trametes cinnabarina]
MTQVNLPPPYQASLTDERVLRATPLLHAGRAFLILGGPVVPPYSALPSYGPVVYDIEKGLLTEIDVGDSFAPPDDPTIGTDRSLTPAAAHKGGVLTNTVWYLWRGITLLSAGVPTAYMSSMSAYGFGRLFVLGFFSPYKDLPVLSGMVACFQGGIMIGGAVGVLGFFALCLRRACMAPEERQLQNMLAAKEAVQWRLEGEDRKAIIREPVEVNTVVPLAALLGAFGLVFSMAFKPGLAAEAQEIGFRYWHAVLLSVWGIIVVFLPSLIGAAISALFHRDPVRGWNAGSVVWRGIGSTWLESMRNYV